MLVVLEISNVFEKWVKAAIMDELREEPLRRVLMHTQFVGPD